MDRKLHFRVVLFGQQISKFFDLMLTLRNGHAVTRDDDHFLSTVQHHGDFIWIGTDLGSCQRFFVAATASK